jgi:hypothetical protein
VTKHKVAELEGALLDAAVALAEGWRPGNWGLHGFRLEAPGWTRPAKIAHEHNNTQEDIEIYELWPQPWSSSWAHGGPIIERERPRLDGRPDSSGDGQWTANGYWGPTALIASMRAYVASKFGDDVELP